MNPREVVALPTELDDEQDWFEVEAHPVAESRLFGPHWFLMDFAVPEPHRQGRGRYYYRLWESQLPEDVERLVGNATPEAIPFWLAMGWEFVFTGDENKNQGLRLITKSLTNEPWVLVPWSRAVEDELEEEALGPVVDYRTTKASRHEVEQLQRLPIDELDRLAFGVQQGVQRLPLDKIQIRYQADYDVALDYVAQHPDDYQEALDQEPIEVDLERGVYWLQDGHHRYVTAQIRGDADILADLTIRDNPVIALTERQAAPATELTRRLDKVYTKMEDLLERYDAGDVDFQQYRKELAHLQAVENKLVFRDVK